MQDDVNVNPLLRPQVALPILGIAAFLLTYLNYEPPLASKRPPVDSISTGNNLPALPSVESRYARIWEDPLADKEIAERVDASFPEVFASIRDQIKGNKQLLFLPILLPGGRESHHVERRRRICNAVFSALGAHGYEMSYPDRMSYTKVCILPSWDPINVAGKRTDLVVPIKLFRPRDHPRENPHRTGSIKQVLVCWIDEDALGTHPVEGLAQVLYGLIQKDANSGLTETLHRKFHALQRWLGLNSLNGFANAPVKAGVDLSNVEITVLGPTQSGTLLKMVAELADCTPVDEGAEQASETEDETAKDKLHKEDGSHSHLLWWLTKKGNFKDIRIISPRATVPISRLQETTPQEIFTCFDDHNIQFFRAIGTDDQLVDALHRELGLRDAWPTKADPQRHIVLITEQDSIYGRVLPELFREEVRTQLDGRYQWESLVHTFTYFRGIDGGVNQSDFASSGKHSSGQATSQSALLEQPEGPSQRDYLRRLEQRVSDLKGELRRKGQGDVVAIGVLGSDIYDKLLVLRALRRRFLDCIFFTTDLDARYSMPDEIEHTRNLIVASHFGVELNRQLGYDALPFRDSYQTAAFFGTLKALRDKQLFGKPPLYPEFDDDPWDLNSPPEKRNLNALEPVVYEIGTHGACQLTRTSEMSTASLKVHPIGWLEQRPSFTFYWWACLSLATLFLFIVAARLLRPAQQVGQWIAKVWRSTSRWTKRLLWEGSNVDEQHDPEASIGETLGFWLCLLLFVVFCLCVFFDQSQAGGEPFAWYAGISVWPSVALQLTATLTVIVVIAWGRDLVKELVEGDDDNPIFRSREDRDVQDWLLHFRPFIRKVIVPTVVLYIGYILMSRLGVYPRNPYRGEIAHWVSLLSSWVSPAALGLVGFFVVELFNQFRNAIDVFRKGLGQLDAPQSVDAIRKLAETSDKIERLIWWPFVVAALLILARFGGFDLWTYPWPFIAIVAIILLAVLLASLRLRKGASLAKKAAVQLLEDKRMDLLGKSAADQRKASQIAEAISRIEGIRGGALRRLSEHPVLLALTIPFGGGFFAYLDMLR